MVTPPIAEVANAQTKANLQKYLVENIDSQIKSGLFFFIHEGYIPKEILDSLREKGYNVTNDNTKYFISWD